jgi:hypothetical protein
MNPELLIANVVTITRPEVVSPIEEAAWWLMGGSKTEAVALALRRLLDQNVRADAFCPGLIAVWCGFMEGRS